MSRAIRRGCERREALAAQQVLRIVPRNVEHDRPQMVLHSDSGDEVDDSEIDSDSKETSESLDEADVLCARLFAAKVENNMTEDAVTAVCTAWLTSVGKFLPEHIRNKVPHTAKQLESILQRGFLHIKRIPVCPGECTLLDHVTPCLAYTCYCNGVRNQAWR